MLPSVPVVLGSDSVVVELLVPDVLCTADERILPVSLVLVINLVGVLADDRRSNSLHWSHSSIMDSNCGFWVSLEDQGSGGSPMIGKCVSLPGAWCVSHLY